MAHIATSMYPLPDEDPTGGQRHGGGDAKKTHSCLDIEIRLHNNAIIDGLFTGDSSIEKERRQTELLRLIRDQPVANQREIVEFMQKTGVLATQASISRDIRELGLIKLDGRYVTAERVIAPTRVRTPDEAFIGLINGFEPVGANLVVVRTRTGGANSVAVALDKELANEVAGTIAGDDTIFVAVRSRSDQGRVVAALNGWTKQLRPTKRSSPPVSSGEPGMADGREGTR